MKRFQHILVDLALDGQDETVLRWAQQIAELAGAQQITLLHAWEAEEIPETLREKYPWLVTPGKEMLRARAKDLMGGVLRPEVLEQSELHLDEGERLGAVLKVARDEEVDLIVTGRHGIEVGSDQYATRLARKAPCSVFSVRSDRPIGYSTVVVPVDYSSHADRALDFGCALARAEKIEEVVVLRSFAIPYGQHRATISREEFRHDYEQYETERLEGYVAKFAPVDVNLRPVVVENPVATFGITDYVRRTDSDVVVLGSRGRHAASAILLGSTAESVLKEVTAAVLLIKPKGTGLGLLDSLLID